MLSENIIISLVRDGLCMVRAEIKVSGLYVPWHSRVYIRLGLDREEEDVTIAHEWIHAAEDLRYQEFRSPEEVVELSAKRICSKRPELVDLIRSFYQKEGF